MGGGADTTSPSPIPAQSRSLPATLLASRLRVIGRAHDHRPLQVRPHDATPPPAMPPRSLALVRSRRSMCTVATAIRVAAAMVARRPQLSRHRHCCSHGDGTTRPRVDMSTMSAVGRTCDCQCRARTDFQPLGPWALALGYRSLSFARRPPGATVTSRARDSLGLMLTIDRTRARAHAHDRER